MGIDCSMAGTMHHLGNLGSDVGCARGAAATIPHVKASKEART
jgi:hypothetical protein